MPVTLRGIYHNLRESKYTVSNGEIVFFFSSQVYMDKFLKGYKENRFHFLDKITKNVGDSSLNMSTLADISYYKKLEKRGFLVWCKGVELTWEGTQKYALRKMTDENMNDWSKIQKPKLGERLKSMGH